jgi:hypothetical protein
VFPHAHPCSKIKKALYACLWNYSTAELGNILVPHDDVLAHCTTPTILWRLKSEFSLGRRQMGTKLLIFCLNLLINNWETATSCTKLSQIPQCRGIHSFSQSPCGKLLFPMHLHPYQTSGRHLNIRPNRVP